jgi:Family of unknown function (DUF5522)
MQSAKLPRLVQGVDYYLDGGKFVFTAAYHRKRGYCCNSKCRHCPYGADGGLGARISSASISIVGLTDAAKPSR